MNDNEDLEEEVIQERTLISGCIGMTLIGAVWGAIALSLLGILILSFLGLRG